MELRNLFLLGEQIYVELAKEVKLSLVQDKANAVLAVVQDFKQ